MVDRQGGPEGYRSPPEGPKEAAARAGSAGVFFFGCMRECTQNVHLTGSLLPSILARPRKKKKIACCETHPFFIVCRVENNPAHVRQELRSLSATSRLRRNMRCAQSYRIMCSSATFHHLFITPGRGT